MPDFSLIFTCNGCISRSWAAVVSPRRSVVLTDGLPRINADETEFGSGLMVIAHHGDETQSRQRTYPCQWFFKGTRGASTRRALESTFIITPAIRRGTFPLEWQLCSLYRPLLQRTVYDQLSCRASCLPMPCYIDDIDTWEYYIEKIHIQSLKLKSYSS